MKNYYQLLEVPEDASEAEIRQAFRRLARRYHPDRNPRRRRWAEARFKAVHEAYAVLRDPRRRLEYDGSRRTASRSGRNAGAYSTASARESAGPGDGAYGSGRRSAGGLLGIRLLGSAVTGVLGQVLGAEVRVRVAPLDRGDDRDSGPGPGR